MNSVESRNYWPKEWPEWPEDPEARELVADLYDSGLKVLNARASLRKLRLEKAEESSRNYLSQMTEEEREQAGRLSAIWENNALIQQNIRYAKNRKDLGWVDNPLTGWDSAGSEMRRMEEEALQLGLAVNEYFVSRVEQFKIRQEEKDKFGKYHNYPDHSDLRKQWYAREPITEPLTWHWERMLTICKTSEGGGHTAKKRPIDRKLTIIGIVIGIITIVLGMVEHIMPAIF